MSFPRLPICIASRIADDLRYPNTRLDGARKLRIAQRALFSRDPLARKLSKDIFRVLKAHVDRKKRVEMSRQNLADSLVSDLNGPRELREYVIGELARLASVNSPIYDEAVNKLTRNTLVGFSFKTFKKRIKKAAKKVKNIKQAVNKIKAVAKKVKKHDFKKDIAIANAVGKAVGPVVAMAPAPYGPAIASGLSVLEVADKYNKGTLTAEDMKTVGNVLKETGAEEALAQAGVPSSQVYNEIMKVAKTAQRAGKSIEIVHKAKNGDKASIKKIDTIKKEAKKGNPVGITAYDSVKSANEGSKLQASTVKDMIRSIGSHSRASEVEPGYVPGPTKVIPASIAYKSQTMYTPSGTPVQVVSSGDSGVAVGIAIFGGN